MRISWKFQYDRVRVGSRTSTITSAEAAADYESQMETMPSKRARFMIPSPAEQVRSMEIDSTEPKQAESTEWIQIPLQEYVGMQSLLAEMNSRLTKLEQSRQNTQ